VRDLRPLGFHLVHYRTFTNNGDGPKGLPNVTQASNPPITGFLGLLQKGGTQFVASRLLSRPGGIHFWKLTLTSFCKGDLSLATALVRGCSYRFESLDIGYDFFGTSIWHPCLDRELTTFLFLYMLGSTSVDLSRVTRVRDLCFRVELQRIDWITVVLQTITPEHRDLGEISIYLPYD